ncbi:helix-turn-helix domain-containing protein, partial [Paramylibacter ulvae]|uniref:helix-turn-helix domain-containing protein n=1 Tax=Paramylibacter ulvae TaxID=1651968 RepID=UPI00167B3686
DIEAAKSDGSKYRGKKHSYDREAFTKVQDMSGTGAGTSQIAKATGLTRQTVLRIVGDPHGCEAALMKWGL